MTRTTLSPVELLRKHLYTVPLVLSGLLLIFAICVQPDLSLLTGWWKIQISEMGLITDPVEIGGVGAALLNSALILFLSTMALYCRRHLKTYYLLWRTSLSFS